MAIEAGVAAKAAAGLCLVGGGCGGVYYGYKYLATKNTNNEITAPENTQTTTDAPAKDSKYDKALINFLNGDGNDIIFDVKKGAETLSTANLTFENQDTTFTIKADVTANAIGDAAPFKVKEEGKKEEALKEIKAFNGGNWTWSCSITFTRQNGATATTLKNQDAVLKDSEKGLFGILQKDLTTYTHNTEETGKWTLSKLKEAKKNFITQCAEARGTVKNKTLETASSENVNTNLASTKTFTFTEEGTDGEKKLVAQSSSDFNAWFPVEYGTKDYHTGG